MQTNAPSKANNLKKLYVFSNKFIVPKFLVILKKDLNNKFKINKKIKKLFNKNEKLIVRSSSFLEDNLEKSNAGKFLSISNLDNSPDNIINAIINVSKKLKKRDQIIIQEFIYDVDISGVVFTRDPKNNSPYFIINYDKSKKTDLITSGKNNPSLNTKIIYRNYKIKKSEFSNLLKVIELIEKKFKSETLDIEFAIKNKKIYIFQCRNLIVKSKTKLDDKIDVALNNLKKK